ncbi:MAG: carbamate kinase [Clostridiales bacterium]|nr:carbamate kinase [Clostridiales bacterium]
MTEKKGKIVIALGGNALQDTNSSGTAEEQLEVAKRTCEYIVEILDNYEAVIVHGNGPQVGRILIASETAKDITPVMPFDVVGAMSQGYIGYHIQQALHLALKNHGNHIPVATVITQVVVDQNDPAFENPTKPIGSFYSEEEAKEMMDKNGYIMKEDAGRGWRRVVASPIPQRIVEIDTVKHLCGSSVVVAAGGGGIPVIELPDGSLKGVAAVIDKDFAAELLAEQIGADILLILTAVDKVAINYNKPNQIDLDLITAAQAEEYMKQGHFAAGSMLPKIKAAIKFVKSNPGRKAIISSPYKAIEALEGRDGTTIILE